MSETYEVRATRVGRVWALRADAGGRSIHTQCSRLDQAPRTAQEAIALTLDVAESDVTVEVVVNLDPDVRAEIQRLREAQAEASEAQARAARASRELARMLADSGLTVRDSGRLLGISPQRVSQLLS